MKVMNRKPRDGAVAVDSADAVVAAAGLTRQLFSIDAIKIKMVN